MSNNNTKEKTKEIRYKENPFLEDLDIEYSRKQVKVTNLGADDNIIVNQSTGEVNGTHVVTYRKVDNAEFIKLFSKNIALTFELTAAGFKSFMVLAWQLQGSGINRDKVRLDQYTYEDFIVANEDSDPPVTKNFSIQTFQRGLKELVNSKILAKCIRRGEYFINPNFVFNGNRIAFSTVIEREEQKPFFELEKEQDGTIKVKPSKAYENRVKNNEVERGEHD